MGVGKNGIRYTVALLLCLGGLFAGIFVYQHLHMQKKVDVSQFHGTYLEHPRTVNQFNLVDTQQKPFNNSSLQGQWTLVFFGFTNCGYLCPTTMAELAKTYRLLEEKKVKNLPHVMMISIDPERDSSERLAHYVTSFHPSFSGARGDETMVKSMTREMGIAYAKVINKESDDPKNYDVQHSGAVMLFNPQGELNAFFTTPHHADSLAKDYMLLVD